MITADAPRIHHVYEACHSCRNSSIAVPASKQRADAQRKRGRMLQAAPLAFINMEQRPPWTTSHHEIHIEAVYVEAVSKDEVKKPCIFTLAPTAPYCSAFHRSESSQSSCAWCICLPTDSGAFTSFGPTPVSSVTTRHPAASGTSRHV